MRLVRLFDLQYQLAYYKSYHMNEKNVFIHLYCIPLILATAIIMLAKIPYEFLGINFGWLIVIVYSLYYLVLNIPAGIIASFYLFVTGFLTNYLYAHYESAFIFTIALIIHIISWGLQFYGHFHYEKRSPAVFDNLIQPLVLAPYFVVFELLFFAGFQTKLAGNMMNQARDMRRGI